MLRRAIREKREFLYRKSIESKEKGKVEKKQKIRECIALGKKIPSELKDEEAELRKEIEQEDMLTQVPQSFMDDEYRMAGITEPKVMVTTARDPSTKLSAFAKEIRLLFPNAQRVNRGNHVVSQLVEVARQNEITDIVVLHEHRGVPDGLIISHMPFGPTVKFGLYNVVTRSDIGTLPNMSEQYPHLIFDNFKSNLGERVSIILKHLFPTPKTDSKRVMTFANRSDFISFRHHNWRRGRNKKLRPDSGNKKEEAAEQDEGGESDEETIGTLGRNEIELLEVGPRFELRLFEITNGTLDSATADKEWVYRPYMNSRKKRRMDDL